MTTWCAVLVAWLAVSTLPAAQVAQSTGTVSGVAVDAPTGDPLTFAYVELRTSTGQVSRTTTSDSKGTFNFGGVPSGAYVLTVYKPGRPRVFHGGVGARAFEAGEPIQVRAGTAIDDLRVEVPPGAVIAGRVLDTDGEPAVSVYFDLRRNGVAWGLLRTAPTNARGEFRFWELPPGDYTLSVSRDGDNRLDRRYARVYFPNVTDPAQSETITLAPGQERSGVEFRLVEVSTTRVDGRVVGGDEATRASVGLWRQSERAVPGTHSVTAGPGGTFSIPGILPGEYWLGARSQSTSSGSTAGATWALMPISVGSQPVSGLTLVLQPGFTAKGLLRLGGPARDQAELARFWVLATPIHAGFFTDRRESAVAADGTFELRDLAAGRYRVSVSPRRYGPAATIQELAVNGTVNSAFEFEVAVGAAAPQVTIVVAP